MRVVYLTETPRMGGAERVLGRMVAAATEAGHEAVVLAPQEFVLDHVQRVAPSAHVERFGDAGFHDRATMVQRADALLRQIPALASRLRALRPDVLHVSNGGHPGSGLCLLALPTARLAGVPHRVLSVHATPRPRQESRPAVQTVLDRLAWANADVVAGATRFVGDQLAATRGMPAERYRLVPYGVEPPGGAEDAATFRAEHGIGPDEPLVAMISATDDEQKGHAVLIEALGQAPGVRAVIVGATPPPAAMARMEDPDLAERVVVAGRVEDVGAVYHAADALVVPSVRDESLPLVVLEAMAAARPVVASRLSGIPEAVENEATGLLVAPGDPAALGAALRRIAADPGARSRWGAAGRRVWAERFSDAAMARATLDLYR